MSYLFVDTANLDDISDILSKGIVSGITTNPSLMSKEPKSGYVDHMKKIVNIIRDVPAAELGELPLSVEVFAKDPDKIYDQARQLRDDIDYGNLNIKIPIGYKELEVINKLNVNADIEVNCTCCFTASQLCLAAEAGSRYVSFFYNRAIDSGIDPDKTLGSTKKFIKSNYLNCSIISGSIRKPEDIENAWMYGSDIVTAGYNVIVDSCSHPGTTSSVDQFMNDFATWIS